MLDPSDFQPRGFEGEAGGSKARRSRGRRPFFEELDNVLEVSPSCLLGTNGRHKHGDFCQVLSVEGLHGRGNRLHVRRSPADEPLQPDQAVVQVLVTDERVHILLVAVGAKFESLLQRDLSELLAGLAVLAPVVRFPRGLQLRGDGVGQVLLEGELRVFLRGSLDAGLVALFGRLFRAAFVSFANSAPAFPFEGSFMFCSATWVAFFRASYESTMRWRSIGSM